MTSARRLAAQDWIEAIPAERPILIAGPTASGKSELALQIAETHGGVIVNADASQVYGCWRILTARPDATEEARAPHRLYGHIPAQAPYSAGHWLREVREVLKTPERAIIVGGTGLYFSALTQGLADIPAIPSAVRGQADTMAREEMLKAIDPDTCARIDTLNPVRVQRAWEVQTATGRSLTEWQRDTGPALLPLSKAQGIVMDAPKDWLSARIARRFDQMIDAGVLDEARQVLPVYNPSLPAHRAIGAPELIAYLRDQCSLEHARDAAVIATRQFAKRQRTWFRSKMRDWHAFTPEG